MQDFISNIYELTLNLLNRRKFVLTIGDEGAILTLINKSELENRIFASSPFSEAAEKLKSLLKQHKKVPVYVLIDTTDQTFSQQTIPPVSSFALNGMVKRKLRKDFDETDIKAAVKQGKSKSSRKDWQFVFISIPNVPPISEWLDTILEMPNKFAGIYSLPIEVGSVVKKLDKYISSDSADKQAIWKIIVTHNKVGGFRQVVLKNYKFVITRINQPVGVDSPEVIAGNIEQDLENTIEYIRRIGFNEKEGLDVVICASGEIIKSLEDNKVAAQSVKLFTPHQLAERLEAQKAAKPEDKYCDTLLAIESIRKNVKAAKLASIRTAKIEKYHIMDQMVIVGGVLLILILISFGILKAGDVYDVSEKIPIARQIQQESANKFNAVKEETEKFPEDSSKIINTIYLYNIFTSYKNSAFLFLERFAAAKGYEAIVSSFNIRMEKFDTGQASPNESSVIHLATGEKIYNPPSMNIKVTLHLTYVYNTFEELLEMAKSFKQKVTAAFPEFGVNFHNLPDNKMVNLGIGGEAAQLDFGDKQVSITFSGPDLKKIPKNKTAR